MEMEQTKHYHRGLFTGAFDPIHSDHIKALKLSSSMCDELIVAVSTDEVIKDYKHHDPAIPFEERIAIVDELKCVTKAIPQNDLHDKLQMCLDNGIDVLFSCDEYLRSSYPDPDKMTLKQKAGVERWEKFEQQLNEYGIDVIYNPRGQSTSSTDIKESVAQSIGYQQPQGVMLYSEGECMCEDVFSL